MAENKLDWDYFFYSGKQLDLDAQIRSELTQGLMQRLGVLFFHRSNAAGIPSEENTPNTATGTIATKYRIAKWIGERNLEVSIDAADRDRRVAASQDWIKIKLDGPKKEIIVRYIPLYDSENYSEKEITI